MFTTELPKQGPSVLGSCPAATGNHAGGGRCVFQQCLFLQSVLVLLFCRSCLFTPRSGDENFKLLLSSRAHFCVGNVICCWCPGGIHGKSSCGLAPAYSAVCFEWKGGRTGEERVPFFPWHLSYWKVKSGTGKGEIKGNYHSFSY